MGFGLAGPEATDTAILRHILIGMGIDMPLGRERQVKVIAVRAIAQARLGNEERLEAIRRLDRQARLLERTATGPSLPALAGAEMQASHAFGGRSVFGWEPPGDSAPARSGEGS